MKNTTTIEVKGLTIPYEVLEAVGFTDAITLTAFEDVIILKKSKMTALEMIQTIEGLEHVAIGLYEELLANFHTDDECENCTFCDDFIEDSVEVPDWAKEVAGIDADTKLCISVEEDSEKIILEPVSYAFDITDVSEKMLVQLSCMGVCLGELNESIMQEEIVYED